jgi:hypothetical protein
LNLWEVVVRPVGRLEEHRFQELMQEHHYLGCVLKISETLWYIALLNENPPFPRGGRGDFMLRCAPKGMGVGGNVLDNPGSCK